MEIILRSREKSQPPALSESSAIITWKRKPQPHPRGPPPPQSSLSPQHYSELASTYGSTSLENRKLLTFFGGEITEHFKYLQNFWKSFLQNNGTYRNFLLLVITNLCTKTEHVDYLCIHFWAADEGNTQ